MKNEELDKLRKIYKGYIVDNNSTCISEDEFIFYGGDGDDDDNNMNMDRDSYSDSYSDNW